MKARSLQKIFGISFAMALATTSAAMAQAQPADGFFSAQPLAKATTSQEKPLLVIRFNQSRVYFDRMLSKAIDAAKSRSPDASFEVVSFMPARANAQLGGVNLQSVLAYMNAKGVTKVTVTQSPAPVSMATQEIHIFVR